MSLIDQLGSHRPRRSLIFYLCFVSYFLRLIRAGPSWGPVFSISRVFYIAMESRLPGSAGHPLKLGVGSSWKWTWEDGVAHQILLPIVKEPQAADA
ncbi:hypothetical protein GGR53DRAFT_184233 [Hypoxylon sp. FL1150]|nr:hypothetical protein GGR53DRAFT_184233 [Hypoxylon sp. FL1150]